MSVKFSLAKRLFDIIVSLAALFIATPILLILIFTNWFFLGFPIFFKQKRIGKGGRYFNIIKFRSMALSSKNKIPNENDLTSYGQFLRKYSLDELPSFWNVMVGDLSIVGPRPLLPEFFSPIYRQSIRPGMTGLAQIKGRNNLNWRKKFRYDLFYIKHACFKLDCYILWKTIPFIFSTSGTDLPSKKDYFPSKWDDPS